MDLFFILNSQLTVWQQAFLTTIFGLIFGSFASLLSYRIVHKEPIIFTHSKCPKCQIKLKIKNLIPVFSWLFQAGKCGECKQKISIRYPLIELSFAVFFLTIFFASGKKIDQKMILLCLISFTLILMSITDLEHYFIPNSLQYLLAILIIILRIYDDGIYGAINNLKAALAFTSFGLFMLFFFYITTKIEAIGGDDIKFFFLAGLLLGISGLLLFMLLSGIFGVIFGIIWQKLKRDNSFPFAPAMCLSMFFCILFGNQINAVDLIGNLIF